MKKKILITDDDPGIIDALRIMLEDANYDVETTQKGQTVYKVKEQLPDLILLDVWMAGEDGRDICKYLKHQNITKHIPIIMVSATHNLAKSAKEAGAEDFITKPFQMKTLLKKIAFYTEHPHKNVTP